MGKQAHICMLESRASISAASPYTAEPRFSFSNSNPPSYCPISIVAGPAGVGAFVAFEFVLERCAAAVVVALVRAVCAVVADLEDVVEFVRLWLGIVLVLEPTVVFAAVLVPAPTFAFLVGSYLEVSFELLDAFCKAG